MKYLKALLGSALAAGILAAGLIAGEPAPARADKGASLTAAPAFAGTDIASFPNAMEFPLAEGMELNGVPVRVSYLVTDRPAEEVYAFYRREFSRYGLPLREQENKDVFGLSLVMPASSTTRVAVIRRSGSQTMAFLGEFPFEATPFRVFPEDDGDVPYGPNTVSAFDLASSGKGRGRVVFFHETERLPAVRERIDGALRARGWVPADRNGQDPTLSYKRRGEHANLLLKSLGPDAAATSVLFQTSPEDSE